MWRAYRSIDIARELGTDLLVLWLAREGTLCAESKSPVWATKQLVDAINKMLEYDKGIRVCIEPQAQRADRPLHLRHDGPRDGRLRATIDPKRVGGNLESAHAILAGLDPANEIGFAMAFGKLFHRAPQRSERHPLRSGQELWRGNLRAGLQSGESAGGERLRQPRRVRRLDVKAMRTTSDEDSYEHLKNSLDVFKALEEKVARWDYDYTGKLIAERKFEQLEMYTMNLLMGIDK